MKIVSFVLVTIALIGVVTLFLHPEHAARYSDERSVEANRIFDERENSIDVIFLGHSGVYSGISPMEIYKKYGFTSYDFSQARQLPWESLEMLKAVLKVQKPAVLRSGKRISCFTTRVKISRKVSGAVWCIIRAYLKKSRRLERLVQQGQKARAQHHERL